VFVEPLLCKYSRSRARRVVPKLRGSAAHHFIRSIPHFPIPAVEKRQMRALVVLNQHACKQETAKRFAYEQMGQTMWFVRLGCRCTWGCRV
jgi:hypothetical protein